MAPSAKRVPPAAAPGRGLIWQLFFLLFLPVTALTLMIAFGGLALHQRAMRNMVGERDGRAVQTAAIALEEQLMHRQDAMRGLAQRAAGSNQDRMQDILASSDYLLDDFHTGLAFFRSDGELAAATGDVVFWEGVGPQVSPLIGELVSQSESKTYISSGLTHPVSGAKMILVLAASGDGKWIAAGASSAAELVNHALGSAFATGPQASAVVLDSKGELLYQAGAFSYAGQPAAHPGVAEALRGESGVNYVQVGNSEHVVAYSSIAPVGWAIALEEPWETVDTPTLRVTQLAPLVVVPVLLLMLLALWFGLRQIIRPLQELEARAAALAWGDFETIEQPVGGVVEIRQLQAELVHMARKVKAAQQSLHSYIGAITAGQEEERKRLARELHDDTMQSMVALKQRVQLAQLSMKNGASDGALAEIVSLTEQTIENLRRQTKALRPIYLEDLGLVTALEMLAREISQAANIPVDFSRSGDERRLEADIELALYRMVQEALNNIARHAQASRASVNIAFSPHLVTIQVMDDGKGFEIPKSPGELAPSGHFGLLGLYERAELIGAKLQIQSSPGRGTLLTVTYPELAQ